MRRVSGDGAGLLAGAVLALTPVAALMFRFNNPPDALLVLLMVVAAYCVVRALEGKSTRWIALAGVAIGLAFLTKLLQALLVTPPPSRWWCWSRSRAACGDGCATWRSV